MRHTVMIIERGFKIRKKADVKKFMDKCMQNKSVYSVQTDKNILYFEKDSNGNFSVSQRQDDWVSIELTRTNNGNGYKYTVEELIWENRKYINSQWLSPRD